MTKDKFIDWLHGFLEGASNGMGLLQPQVDKVLEKLNGIEAETASPIVQVIRTATATPPEDDEEDLDAPEVPENLRHRPPPIPAGRLIRG